MAEKKAKRTKRKKTQQVLPDCPLIDEEVSCLGDYFNIFNSVIGDGKFYWFRGHADISWELRPSALRYKTESERNRAIGLLSAFKRYGEIKIPNPPSHDEDLKWLQLARHYGLPTRLLDWTQNAAIALYLACQKAKDKHGYSTDGAIFILDPLNLNTLAFSKRNLSRILDANTDADIIAKYLNLSGKENSRGLKTIAINPIWNSERIMLQQGVFTLHGSRHFILDKNQAPGLSYIAIKQCSKHQLLIELERIGIHEMAIYPEPEHLCNYLKWAECLQ